MCAYVLNDCQRKLVEANLSLVPYVVKKYLTHRPLEFDDMISFGYYALCRAAISFSENKGHSFSTYATKCIIHQVDREVRHMNCKKRGYGQIPIPLNERVYDSFENNCERIDLIIDNTVDVESQAMNSVMLTPVWKRVPCLAEIISTGKTETQLAEEHGVSVSCYNVWKHEESKNARAYLLRHKIYDLV